MLFTHLDVKTKIWDQFESNQFFNLIGESGMKRNICQVGLAALVVLLLMTGQASAQNLDINAYAYNVPFAFRAGTMSFPAGQYAVRIPSSGKGIICIENLNGASRTMFLATPFEQGRMSEPSKLVFHQYGNAYFLSKVWNGFSATGLQFPTSGAEKEFKRQASIPKTIDIALSPR
jgi:hypothetical protein